MVEHKVSTLTLHGLRFSLDYGRDVGYYHVMDHAVHQAKRWLVSRFTPAARDHTCRYLDGEEEREGTYR